MPRFFFHVREGADFSRDREGQEFPDAEAARREAINSGREILGERLLHGGSLSNCQIEIADGLQSGRVIDVVNASDVLFQRGQFRSYKDDITQSAPVGTPKNDPSK